MANGGRLFGRFRGEGDVRRREVVRTLKAVPLFGDFSRGVLADLAEAVHVRDYRRDEYLYYEHDPGLGLYVVQHGRVRLLVEDAGGQMQELRQVGENEVFGHLSLLGDVRRLETARAVIDTRVLGLFRPDLHSILRREPATAAAVLAAVAEHLAFAQAGLLRFLDAKAGKVEARRLLHDLTRHVDAARDDAAEHEANPAKAEA